MTLSPRVGTSRRIALEWAAAVRVNVIWPGLIDTAGWQADIGFELDLEAFLAPTRAMVPLGRVGQPEEVGAAVVMPTIPAQDAAYAP